MAVDTLGHLLALHVTPANADDRTQVARLAKAVQAATDDSVEPARSRLWLRASTASSWSS